MLLCLPRKYHSEDDDYAPVDYSFVGSVAEGARRQQAAPIHREPDQATARHRVDPLADETAEPVTGAQPAQKGEGRGYEAARRIPRAGDDPVPVTRVAYPRPRDNAFAKMPTYSPQPAPLMPTAARPGQPVNGVPTYGGSRAGTSANAASAVGSGTPMGENAFSPSGRGARAVGGEPPMANRAFAGAPDAQAAPGQPEDIDSPDGSQFAKPAEAEIPDWLRTARQNNMPLYAERPRSAPRVEAAPNLAQEPVPTDLLGRPIARREPPKPASPTPISADEYAAAGYPPQLIASHRDAEAERAAAYGVGRKRHGAQLAAPPRRQPPRAERAEPDAPKNGGILPDADAAARDPYATRMQRGYAPRYGDPARGGYAPPAGYPAQDGYAPRDGDFAQEGYAPPANYAAQDGYAPPAGYPAQDGYVPPAGYPAQDGYAPSAAYPPQDGYASRSGDFAQDGYAPPAAYPPQDGYAPPQAYPARGRYAKRANDPDAPYWPDGADAAGDAPYAAQYAPAGGRVRDPYAPIADAAPPYADAYAEANIYPDASAYADARTSAGYRPARQGFAPRGATRAQGDYAPPAQMDLPMGQRRNPYGAQAANPRGGWQQDSEAEEEQKPKLQIPYLGIATFAAAVVLVLLWILQTTYTLQTKDVLAARVAAQAKLSDRHPFAYRELIEREAAANNLHPAFVAAIVLNESSFNPNAESSVGARGLMQMMPDTAEWVHGKIGDTDEFNFDRMYDPDTNVRYACWYLAFLSERFHSDPVLVSAAFHAGQSTVQNWLNDSRYSLDSQSIKLENMAEGPTKTYATKVVNAFATYRRLYYEGGLTQTAAETGNAAGSASPAA